MSATVLVLLTLIEGMLATITNPTVVMIDKFIAALAAIVPTLANSIPAAVTSVENIISALKTSGNVTPAQMASLTALDAQVDAAFEAAATAAGAPPATS